MKRAFCALDFPQRAPTKQSTDAQKPASAPSAIRFEPMEARVLLAADPVLAVTGAISTPGETDHYTFTVASDTKVVFDSLTNDPNLNWSLDGPGGNVVNERSFPSSDSTGLSGSPAITLAAGDYSIAVDASLDATGPYGFRLLDLAKADGIVSGTAVTGQISPANETETYKFDANAGDHFFLDVTGRSGGDLTWQLLDPSGQQIFGPTAMNSASQDIDLASLPATGTYSLLVEGKIGASETANYSFTAQLLPPDYVPPTEPVTTNTWIGTVGGNWNLASNWSKGTVPVATDNVFIGLPAGQTVTLSSGTVTVNSLTCNADLTLSGGATLNLNGISKINGNVNLSAGTLGGTGALTVVGSFNVTATNTLNGTGTLTTQGTSVVTGTINLTGGKTWVNQGTLTVGGAGAINFGYASGGTNTLTNAAGATLNLSSSAGVPLTFYTGTAIFNNAGTLNHTVSGTHSINGAVAFNNSGTVNVSAGTLSIDSGGSDWGAYSIAAGAGCNFNGGTRTLGEGWNVDGDGAISITGGVTNVIGWVICDGNLTLAGGTLGGTGTLLVHGSFYVTATSYMTGTGTLITAGTSRIESIVANASLNISGGRTWSNQGTLTIAGDDYINFGAYGGGTNTLINEYWATLNLSSSAVAPLSLYTGTAILENAGTLNHTVSGTHAISSSITFNNSGTVNVSAGTLSYNRNLTNQGTVSIDPGARMSVGGSFSNSASATVRLGVGNATTIGVLSISGTASLNGTLNIFLAGGYVPAESDIFNVMTYASRAGSFSTLLGESPGAQVTFSVDTASDPKTLKVKSIVVTGAVQGVDLVVTGLGLAADSILRSGDSATVVWNDSNTGTLATTGSWTDRLVVKRVDTGEVLADIVVPYDEALEGPIAGGASVARQASFVLPPGNRGAGNLSFTVTTDSAGSVSEVNPLGLAENNNTGSINLLSALAPYPDLVVANVTASPPGGWLAGDSVTLSWRTLNQGDSATSGSWTETLRVRNLTTGQPLFTQNLAYDAALLGDIAAGGQRERSLTLIWPTGANASGNIEFTVTTDSVGQVFENNPAGTAESNNSSQVVILSAPDLVVGALTSDTPSPKTGDLITLSWNDFNIGNTAVSAGWYDRIRVINQTTSTVLVDQQLRYDLPAGDPLAVGASAPRSFSFRLAEGNAGAGNLLVQVIADQNTSAVGSLTEANAGGTGESNNTASINLTSTLAAYADLQVTSVTPEPAFGWLSGDAVTVAWTTRNQGDGATTGSWTETLRVRNLTTGQILLTQNLPYDASLLGGIEAGGQRERSLLFTWPTGANANGRIEFTVTTDAASQVFENNASGTAETNNANQIIVLSAPDLVVNGLTSDSPAPMTGDLITLTWNDVNIGNAALNTGWFDRIRVTNQTTSAVLVDQQLRYELPAGDVLATGASAARSFSFRLADGNAGVGNLLIQVTADQNVSGMGTLVEVNAGGTGESNNSASLSLTSTLASYPDLVPENCTLSPSTDFQPGQQVTASWSTVNRGDRAADRGWSERLEVVNLTTGAVVATAIMHDDLSEGALDVHGARARTAQFTWPTGASALGRFAIRISVDSAADILEANDGGTAESNNLLEFVNEVGSDMQVRNLRVDTPAIEAGGLVSISWEDWNLGANPASIPITDRIVVRNAASQVLVDTTLAYDPMASTDGVPNGPIQPGESRSRTLTFRLPEGLVATGEIGISVTTDQNRAGLGVLYETNGSGDAEANNSANTGASSAAKPYADLRVDNVDGSLTGVGGEPVTVSWTVSNHGQAGTEADWNDQIVFSNDAVIGNADDVVIGTVRHVGGLETGASYSQTATVRVPMRSMGRYYLGIRSDSNAEVVEPDTRSDNASSPRGIDLATAYADLNLLEVTAPTLAKSGEDILVTWSVRNDGNATTNLALWNDKLVLSRDTTLSADDVILSGSITHSGLLSPGQGYTGRATMTLPRDLSGDYYVIVDTSTNRSVFEDGRIGNNSRASIVALHIDLAPVADLTVADVTGPAALRPGDSATVSYTVTNQGAAAATGSWRDRIYVDNAGALTEVANLFFNDGLAIGATKTRNVTFTLPTGLANGTYRWVVKTDTDDTLYERGGEANNQATSVSPVTVSRIDLAVSELSCPSLAQSGDSVHVGWKVTNWGGLATGSWVDRVYLSKSGVLSQVAEVSHAGPLATGAFYTAAADFTIPLDSSGEYQIVVVTDPAYALVDGARANNQALQALHIDFSPYADLTVTGVTAPDRVIDDPAPLDVSWTVTNLGTGAGRISSWTDRVILSTDDTFGNGDDRVVGEFRHDGALGVGESYSRSERVLASPGTSARYKLFVVSDARGEVFENYSEANNLGRAGHNVDIMPVPYADLQVASVTTEGSAASGRPLRVTWEVVNNGIGLTSTADWSDSVWLSRNPDGSGVVTTFGSAGHIGQLAVGDRYSRSLDVTLPEGIEGTYYLNVRTGGPYEFIFGNNNTGTSLAVPVTLSKSPDLMVESVTLPATAQEGSLVDVSWTVVNQGEATATGLWVDSIWLIPADGTGSAVSLGSYTYDRGLESGIRYTRTEQVRLPAKIEGLYRIKVVTNANLGGGGNQVYEYGAARGNNSLTSADTTEVSMYDRPDLRVTVVSVPEHVTAGTGAAIRYTISNLGAAAASGRWTDKVYLSLDGILSGDDRLVGQFGNAGALAPSEAYANETAMVDIPIRYRGDAYLIVVADGNNNVDEYPNDGNNVRAAHFYIDPVPFGDLVTSNVVAPDQAVHGSNIEVRYQVANLGSQTTRGEAAALNAWTDTIWLARDKRRPGAHKGDILLGSFTHVGNLGVGENYLGTVQVAIPENVRSGEYFVTVWSDTYDVILEDTLAANINPDDAAQVDNNNYKARPISVLGISPPDLAVGEVTGQATAEAEGNYSFSYSVQNRGDLYTGTWVDSVYLTDDPDFSAAHEIWHLGDYTQTRSLGNGERYSVTQTIQLAPTVKGRYLIVRTDAGGSLAESNETNNAGSLATVVTNRPSDLQVTQVVTEPTNYSGEETTVTWTVANAGGAVWAGTRNWVDAVYVSADPSFIPGRATLLGSFVHANVDGLASGGSYTTSAKVRLPVGAEGQYYIYVITDADAGIKAAVSELNSGGDNDGAKRRYAATVFEGARNDNNMARGSLDVIYSEPDLQVDGIEVSESNPSSGQQLTVTWTVTNRGTRATRIGNWYDGLYLSRDASLDNSDYALVDRGSLSETALKLKGISVAATDVAGGKYLKPGDSYTATTSFNLPESISGDFRLIVKADTAISKDVYGYERSSIREGLPALMRFTDPSGAVLEFQGEGNNLGSVALPINLATPPDLQVSQVSAPTSVLAGQTFTVSYRVVNQGGNTPSDQTGWNDLVYLSKDRFLDVNQDRYLGFIQHTGGLAGGSGYDASLTVTAPKTLEGPYYVFVVTDPARAWGTGEYGKVREFGKEQNNATAAVQPILLETPPPADLKVTNVVLPASARVGDEIRIDYTVTNDSINPAYGRWTDALYLSADNGWDLGDILIGKVDHVGDLAGGSSYNGSMTTKLPPLKDGNWRIIVRPDLYNEVFEGKITYTATGLNLPPGEANNRTASGATLDVTVPVLQVASPLATTLSPGEAHLYKVSVAAGETLRVSLDAVAAEGSNELYVRYGDIPTGYAFDASYSNPVATDQEVMIPSTQAGDYYILVRARQGAANSPATLRADLLPLSITKITPDQGGTGDADHRWVTFDILGSHFKAGALVKLSRPGVYEAEPDRWQVLDATHIRAVFNLAKLPHGLYDVTVINPDGQRVTEAERYLVERGIEADVTIGIGGSRTLSPGENGLYSVSLQSLSNVDTPYVRFDVGVPEMGLSNDVLEGLNLPYLVFSSNVAGQPAGLTVDAAGNTQTYGQTPTDGTPRPDVPWARLDGVQNTAGFNLAPGYAFDVPAGGFVGMTFNVQTYPGLAEWIAHDFEGLRAKLYAVRPDWQEQGFLDGGVQDLDKIQEGLTEKFLHVDKENDQTHLTKLEALAMPFRFNVVGTATPLTRDEFIADQTVHAKRLRSAILADTSAPANLSALAADEGQWVAGWLGALESAGLLRPLNEAPPIRDNPEVLSLNATLATGILLSKGGDSYRTQADILGFFAKVQQWYGDTARYGGDPNAAKAQIEYTEIRQGGSFDQDVVAEIPVPVMADPTDYDLYASHDTHFLNFNI
ncbi:MAG: CARDB domain-containing protein [Azonexus sp.]